MSIIQITLCTKKVNDLVMRKLASLYYSRMLLKLKPIELMRKSGRGDISSAIVVVEGVEEYLDIPETYSTLRNELLSLLIRYIKSLPSNVDIVFPIHKFNVDILNSVVRIAIKGDNFIELPVPRVNDEKTEEFAEYLGLKAYKDLVIVNI